MKFLFWIVKFIFGLINILPFRIKYILSDALSPVLNHVVKYRKKVITENLKNSFPEKNKAQIRLIIKGFYQHLTDLIFEILKLDTLTEEELFRRVTVSGEDILTKLAEKKKGVVMVMSHTGNWEWTSQRVCFSGRCFEYVGVIAKEVSDPYFDQYFTDIRMKLQKGYSEIIPFTQTARYLAAIRHKTSMLITIADQTPHKDQIQYRANFLNQDSGIFLGPERIAKSLNFAVVFCHINKKERGQYHIEYELVTDAPKENEPYEITDRHVKMLEEDIRKQPEIWLWSHRRWKY
ncbi:MAG: lysophospholipid acyltransferase family protein [Bacteroidales bacterium]|nr:lysophospholipid acyltransferase family protein [Bacteroidales bacterium]